MKTLRVDFALHDCFDAARRGVKMKIKWFRSVRFRNDWELNFIGKVWNLRIARHQIALWRNYVALFNFCQRDPADVRLGAGSLD